MSALGMNKKGEVRTASEFKSIFEDHGHSFRPYKCPFCEVLYEDRCIITECVKAPHFKLPDFTEHRDACNGEAGEAVGTVVDGKKIPPQRTVEGRIEIPQALTRRRKASTVRRPEDDGSGTPPDSVEIARRRRLIASDKTISNCYTTHQLRPIVHAYKRLRKHAYELAVASKLQPGTKEYNASFGETLSDYVLSLYGQKLTYGNAFQGFKLMPHREERVYWGSGIVSAAKGGYLTIKDSNSWPQQAKSKTDLVAFDVKISRTLEANSSTSHLKAMEELEKFAAAGADIEWYALGVPALRNERFELMAASPDDLYWIGQHKG